MCMSSTVPRVGEFRRFLGGCSVNAIQRRITTYDSPSKMGHLRPLTVTSSLQTSQIAQCTNCFGVCKFVPVRTANWFVLCRYDLSEQRAQRSLSVNTANVSQPPAGAIGRLSVRVAGQHCCQAATTLAASSSSGWARRIPRLRPLLRPARGP